MLATAEALPGHVEAEDLERGSLRGVEAGGEVPAPSGELAADVVRRSDPPPLTINVAFRAPNDPPDDTDELLSRTTFAIAQGTPAALIPVTKDVRSRMRSLSEDHSDESVRNAAMIAHIALSKVLRHLEAGDVECVPRPQLYVLLAMADPVLESLAAFAPDPATKAAFVAARRVAHKIRTGNWV